MTKMRCLIRYQLRGEEHLAHHEFADQAPDLEKVIRSLTEFLHPEVIYEFLPVRLNGEDTVSQLRARMSDARAFLEQYCGLQSLAWRVMREGAPLSEACWSKLLVVEGDDDWSEVAAAACPILPAHAQPAANDRYAPDPRVIRRRR